MAWVKATVIRLCNKLAGIVTNMQTQYNDFFKVILENRLKRSPPCLGNKQKVGKVRFGFLGSHATLVLNFVSEGCVALGNKYYLHSQITCLPSWLIRQLPGTPSDGLM